MFGNIPPFSTPGGYFAGGTVPNATTFNAAVTMKETLTINKTSGSGDFETIASMTVSDVGVSSGYINFRNANGTNGVFAPWLDLRGTGTSTSLLARANVPTDSGANPVFQFDAQTTGGSAITTRPIFNLSIANATVLSALPLNSGANLALSWGTQATAAPAFTGTTGATRSAGTRAILYKVDSASATDIAIGATSSSVGWFSLPDTSSTRQFIVYAGTTAAWRVAGDGLQTNTGGHIEKVRQATTTPVTVAVTDYIIETKLAAPGAVAVNLPASPTTGTVFIIQDGTGDAAANNITITPAAGNINGIGTLVINANYGAKVLTYDGTQWLAR